MSNLKTRLPPEKLLKAIHFLAALAKRTKDPDKRARYLTDVRNLRVLLLVAQANRRSALGKKPAKPGMAV